MIKRPLIWMLSAYLIGTGLAWLKCSGFLVVLFIILIFFIVYLFMFRIKNKTIHRKDAFLWSLPILLLTGFLAMSDQQKKPGIYSKFDQDVPCVLTGRITMIVEKQSGFSLYVTNDTIFLQDDVPYLCENVMVNYFNENQQQKSALLPSDYKVGNKIKVKGSLKKFALARNPGGFNEELYYRIENIDFKMEAKQITIIDSSYSRYHDFLNVIKNRLIQVYSSILPDKEAGTLIAMLLGEKYLLDDDIKKLYQQNGISHILAISGLHVSLIGLFLFGLLKRVRCPIKISTAITIFFIFSYGVLTEFGVSTNRAVVMMIIFLLSPLAGKSYDMLSAISLSALIILLQNPMQILSAGFLLSYSAVLGIAVIYPRLKQLFPYKNAIVNGLFISLSAQIATTPFILLFFYQFPSYSLIVNLIVVPLTTVLTLTSILAGIAGAIYIPLGVFAIGGAKDILQFYEWVCRIGSSLPCNLITVGRPGMIRILLYIILIGMFIWVTCRYKKKVGVMLLAAATLLLILPHSRTGLEVTFLDVGQGDAAVMESRGGTTYLIDGGSSDVSKVGIYRITPFLLSQGIDKLDYAIVSHSDDDHISGLMELMSTDRIKIRNLVLPCITRKDDNYIKLEELAGQYKISIRYITAGDILNDGDMQITCLHPSMSYQAPDSNSYSTVLSVTYRNFDMLLTGDVQKDGEDLVTKLLNDHNYWTGYHIIPAKEYDILKVAHHGSKTSTFEDFLALTKPEISVISCGKDNFYGHPHVELIDRLKAIGSDIKITYETGAIMIKTDGKKMEVQEYIGE